MVSNVTSLTGNGLKDWLVQRATAVWFAGYSLFLLGFLILHPQLDFSQWQALFHSPWFKISSIMALAAISLHAWVGIWTVLTDYIKCTMLRIAAQMFVLAWLLGQFIWGLIIVWGQ